MSQRMGLRPLVACSALFRFQPARLGADQGGGGQPAAGGLRIRRDQEGRRRHAAQVQAAGPTQAQKLQNEIAAIAQKLQTTGKLTRRRKPSLRREGIAKQRELQRINEDLQADVERDRNEICTKSSQKMAEVVRKLAEEKGLDLVVDTSTALYFKPAMDITQDAIAAYDKAYPVPPARLPRRPARRQEVN